MRWISVKDRLPYVISLQFIKGSERGTERHLEYHERFIIAPAGCVYRKATHWMPLPEPPKET